MNADTVAEQVGRIADEFLDRLHRGEAPSVEEYAAAHPTLADVLRGVLPLIRPADPTPPSSPDDTPSPGRLGEFRLVREVGRGGMGVVYEAVQEPLGRRVALKVLPAAAQLHPGYLERFRREARAAAKLHHTNIVPVFGVGESGGVHYYAMQFIEGVSLEKALPGPRVGFREVARWGLQAAEALHYAHQQGVLHRDVKPANLLLDLAGTVWVTDFGLAKLTDGDDLTGTGDFLGTLRYAAPECLRGPADARSDVYSLGATLYELLTGRPVCNAPDREQLVRQIAEEEPPRPRRLNPAVPRDLETVVLKAVAKEPARRYQTAQALADDLRRFLADEPVLARRLSAAGRAWRWCRRNPALAGVSAALVLAFAAGLGGVLWQWQEARHQRDDAIAGRRLAQENRRQAFAAAEQMLTRVGQWQLKDIPQAEAERRRLLEDALSFFQGFLQQDGDDPETRLEVGNAQRRVANVYAELGRFDDAEAAYRRAVAIHSSLTEQFPGEARYRQELAGVLLDFGLFGTTRRPNPQAEDFLQRAAGLFEELQREQPDQLRPRQNLRNTLRSLFLYYVKLRQVAAAEAAFDRYLAVHESLTREHTDSADETLELIRAFMTRASLCEVRNKFPDALGWYRQALATLEPVARGRSDRTDDVNMLATVYGHTGRAHLQAGQPAEAEAALAQAERLWEQLARKHPFVPSYRMFLAIVHSQRARALQLLNRIADALDAYTKSVAESESLADGYPERPEYRSHLAAAYNDAASFFQRSAGQPAKAEALLQKGIAITDDLTRSQPTNVEVAEIGISLRTNLANLLRTLDRSEESLGYYDKNIAWLEAALARNPQDDVVRYSLFAARLGRGLSLMKLERRDAARPEWQRVIELSDGQTNPAMRPHRPMPLAYLGEHARAAAEIEAVLAKQKPLATTLYDFACAYGTAALAAADDARLGTPERDALSERYATRAVELLAQAQAAGYFASPTRGVKSLKRWEFDRLQSRPAFQQLLREVSAAPPPEKK